MLRSSDRLLYVMLSTGDWGLRCAATHFGTRVDLRLRGSNDAFPDFALCALHNAWKRVTVTWSHEWQHWRCQLTCSIQYLLCTSGAALTLQSQAVYQPAVEQLQLLVCFALLVKLTSGALL